MRTTAMRKIWKLQTSSRAFQRAFGRKDRRRYGRERADLNVSLLSLNACSGWSDVEVRPIQFGGTLAAHTEIVQSKIVIAKILDWLVGFEGGEDDG